MEWLNFSIATLSLIVAIVSICITLMIRSERKREKEAERHEAEKLESFKKGEYEGAKGMIDAFRRLGSGGGDGHN